MPSGVLVCSSISMLPPNMLSLASFAGMTLNKCAVLQIGTTEGPMCRGSHPVCSS